MNELKKISRKKGLPLSEILLSLPVSLEHRRTLPHHYRNDYQHI